MTKIDFLRMSVIRMRRTLRRVTHERDRAVKQLEEFGLQWAQMFANVPGASGTIAHEAIDRAEGAEAQARAVRDEHGALLVDVKKNEEALRKAHGTLRSLARRVPAGGYIGVDTAHDIHVAVKEAEVALSTPSDVVTTVEHCKQLSEATGKLLRETVIERDAACDHARRIGVDACNKVGTALACEAAARAEIERLRAVLTRIAERDLDGRGKSEIAASAFSMIAEAEAAIAPATPPTAPAAREPCSTCNHAHCRYCSNCGVRCAPDFYVLTGHLFYRCPKCRWCFTRAMKCPDCGLDADPPLIDVLDMPEYLVCVGCGLKHGVSFPCEPSVSLRSDGRARCNDCWRKTNEMRGIDLCRG